MSDKLNMEQFKAVISGLLERVIFSPEDFALLKQVINELAQGKITARGMREAIVKSRTRIQEELEEILPFHISQQLTLCPPSNEQNASQMRSVQKELREKDTLISKLEQELQEKASTLLEIAGPLALLKKRVEDMEMDV